MATNNYPSFTHEVAYYGLAKIAKAPVASGGTPVLVPLLATGGDISVNHEPIMSTGVWGAGWKNAAENVAYAYNVLRIEGSVNYELSGGSVFEAIQSFAFDKRADVNGHFVHLKPQGKAGFEGLAWCSGCSFDGSEGAAVTSTVNFSSGHMDPAYWKTVQTDGTNAQTGSELGDGHHPGLADTASAGTAATGDQFLCLYPYWATGVALGTDIATIATSDTIPNVINWSSNYSSEVTFLTTCKADREYTAGQLYEKGPIAPDYIMVGTMTSDGSFTVLTVSDQISPAKFHAQKACAIFMSPNNALGAGSTPNKIKFPNIVFSTGSTAIQTGGAYITSDISFTGIGDGSAPPMGLE